MQVSLKSITPNAEINLVEIARVSSSREDKTEDPSKLINYLIKNKHWSPFQHSYLTFEIETSKAIAIQLLRHLSFTFQEFSQRYSRVENLEPIEFRRQAEKNRQSSTETLFDIVWIDDEKLPSIDVLNSDFISIADRIANHLKESKTLYGELIDMGVAKECARFILPMCTQTKLYMTGSIRSWIHCLAIRDDSHAQKEAQEVAKEIKKIFIKELPLVSKALEWT